MGRGKRDCRFLCEFIDLIPPPNKAGLPGGVHGIHSQVAWSPTGYGKVKNFFKQPIFPNGQPAGRAAAATATGGRAVGDLTTAGRALPPLDSFRLNPELHNSKCPEEVAKLVSETPVKTEEDKEVHDRPEQDRENQGQERRNAGEQPEDQDDPPHGKP